MLGFCTVSHGRWLLNTQQKFYHQINFSRAENLVFSVRWHDRVGEFARCLDNDRTQITSITIGFRQFEQYRAKIPRRRGVNQSRAIRYGVATQTMTFTVVQNKTPAFYFGFYLGRLLPKRSALLLIRQGLCKYRIIDRA